MLKLIVMLMMTMNLTKNDRGEDDPNDHREWDVVDNDMFYDDDNCNLNQQHLHRHHHQHHHHHHRYDKVEPRNAVIVMMMMIIAMTMG